MLSTRSVTTLYKHYTVIICLAFILAACVVDEDDSPKAWGTAILIETDNAGDAKYPHVAIDANGNGLAVWRQADGTYDSIWANRYDAATGWGTPTLIENDDAGDAYNPRVAFDTNGNALAVWEQSDGRHLNIWANRYDVVTGWGEAVLIETDDAGDTIGPQIAIDANGNGLAAWGQFDGTRWNSWANRYDVATGWGTPTLIETDDAGDAYSPRIAFDTNGNALAVWEQSDGTRFNIRANRYDVITGWGTAVLIETDDAGDTISPQIAIDANGNGLAAWGQFDGTRWNIWANRYDAVTGWGAPSLIETDDAGSAYLPDIAFDANGNALTVWMQDDGTRYNILANRYDAATGWDIPILIEADDAGPASAPEVTVDANGNALAIWWQSDGTRANIWANRYDVVTGWGTPALIETDDIGDAYSPQIAIDANGNALAVWWQFDGTRWNIWANRYE